MSILVWISVLQTHETKLENLILPTVNERLHN
jgi:hypothetical protein